MARGAKIFAQSCAVCHQIAGQGKIVGPQLDGIGSRGLDRIIEDVLDPNRNVDPSFRYTTFVMANNDVITALPKRQEGDALVVTDTTGKEITITIAKIKQRIQSNASLMPDNFATALPQDDFDDLIAYLLSQRPTQR
jgi:putative heme-binding domain-containing protein